jgi:progressive ankylosis protein ANKH
MLTYWRFYWPLALTGVGMVLSVQFQNATLARYPEAITELAVLALAHGVFGFFNASLQFTSQLANVYARSGQASSRTWQFVVMASIAIMLPLLLIATTPPGDAMIRSVFSIDAPLTARVREYLLLMCPLVLLNGQRHYLSGLMIQARRTGWVTVCNFIYLGSVIALLIIGFTLGGKPAHVIVGAEVAGVSILVMLLLAAKVRAYQLPAEPEHEHVTFSELLKFFIPVSTTGVMFALSRPVLFAFVARTPNGLLAIAALRVAFDFSMLFQQAANQFRHFFISFGFDNLAKKRRFMIIIALGITAIMLLVAITPLSYWIWQDLMSVPPELMTLSIDVLLVMCLMPVVIIYRNYFHSRLMHLRRTSGMAYGSMARVLGIFLLAAVFAELNWLNHLSAAGILIFGFLIEAVFAQQASQRIKAAIPAD